MPCTKPVCVAYAEDHNMVRLGIISLLSSYKEIAITIDAANGKELINKIAATDEIPDVCLVDIAMPVMDGFETTRELAKRWPGIKILALTVHNMELYIIRMIVCGAHGYLLKNCHPAEVKNAILEVYKSGVYFSGVFTPRFLLEMKNKPMQASNLTAMETELLKYCCSEMSYADIAEAMHTTTKSIEGTRDRLFKKLDVTSRVGLVMFAVRLGIVALDSNRQPGK